MNNTYRQGQVQTATVENLGVLQTFSMDASFTMWGRQITQMSMGMNLGSKHSVLTFFADANPDGTPNPHVVATLSPDSGFKEIQYYPPAIPDGGEEPA